MSVTLDQVEGQLRDIVGEHMRVLHAYLGADNFLLFKPVVTKEANACLALSVMLRSEARTADDFNIYLARSRLLVVERFLRLMSVSDSLDFLASPLGKLLTEARTWLCVAMAHEMDNNVWDKLRDNMS